MFASEQEKRVKEELSLIPEVTEMVLGRTIIYHDAFECKDTKFVITSVTQKCVEGMMRVCSDDGQYIVEWPSTFKYIAEGNVFKRSHGVENCTITHTWRMDD